MKSPFTRKTSRLSVLSAALLCLLLAGCSTTPQKPQINYTGDPIVDGRAELAVADPKDKVLWNYRIAAAAMRMGDLAEARLQLDTALPLVGGILTNAKDAKKARRLFSSESSKTFIGEPYERVMAYYYRGILYWQEGQPDNARACFRNGEFIDSDAEANEYKGDYVLLDYLDALASAKLSADGSDALARAEKNAKRKLPPLDPEANVLVFAEFGTGPRKYGGGEYGEQLRFITVDSKVYSALLKVDGKIVQLIPYDDLNFQATTRGGRVMDYILGNKAVFKSTTDTVGDVALVGAAAAASGIRHSDGSINRDAEAATIALGAIGLVSKIASAATTPSADTRTWDNLPQRLSFAATRLAPGQYPATIEFLDKHGVPFSARTRHITLTINPDKDTVVFLSELQR